MNIVALIAALVAAPLMPGIVNKVKALFAGRRGPGLFRLYFDIAKLMRKSCPRSATSTWIFDVAPAVGLASTVVAAAIFPWTASGDAGLFTTASAVTFFYLMGLGRFFTVLGALDTGSAFEGMGASREAFYSALVEPVVFTILGFLVLLTNTTSLSGMLGGYDASAWSRHSISLVFAATAFFVALLSECCRVPFDDPETHLELTMIHEAMVLDNSGPDLAFIHYAAALKFELLAAFLVAALLPETALGPAARFGIVMAGAVAVAIAVGVVESVIARMRFLKTPQVITGAFMLAALSVILYVM